MEKNEKEEIVTERIGTIENLFKRRRDF